MLSPSVLLPSFLQQLQGYTPAQTGMLMASRGAASMVSMFVASALAARLEARTILAIGMVSMAFTLWLMSGFSVDTPAREFAVVGALQGFAMPFTFIPLQFVAYATLKDSSRTEAGALITLARNVGGSAGISIVVALLARSAQVNQSYLGEHFTPYSVERWQSLGVDPGSNAGTGAFVSEIARQALAISYSNDFHLLAAATLLCLPLVMLLRRAAAAAPVRRAETDVAH
jgi:DHA2 family multidrug resistance protein